jgi:tellurite resistance protein
MYEIGIAAHRQPRDGGLPTMAMRMLERGDSGPMTWAAPILFASANLVIAWLAVSSLRLLVHGTLLPTAAAPTESPSTLTTQAKQA